MYSIEHETMTKVKPQPHAGSSSLPKSVFKPVWLQDMIKALEINNRVIAEQKSKGESNPFVVRAAVAGKLSESFGNETVAGGLYLRLCALTSLVRERDDAGQVSAADLLIASKMPFRKKTMSFDRDKFADSVKAAAVKFFNANGELSVSEKTIRMK